VPSLDQIALAITNNRDYKISQLLTNYYSSVFASAFAIRPNIWYS